MPVPPFRVTFPELLPEAIAANAAKQSAEDATAQAEDASLEPLRVEVRIVLAPSLACAGPGWLETIRFAPTHSALRKTHISTESF